MATTHKRMFGSYLAKKCPHDVARDADPNYTEEMTDAPTDAQSERMDAGKVFEEAVKQLLLAANPATVTIPAPKSHTPKQLAKREKLTQAAMSAGVELIWNPRLPADVPGRRVGEPDLLVRGPKRRNGVWSYRPVDVKWHAVRTGKGTRVALVSGLDKPQYAKARKVTNTGRTRIGDDLQLAHYVRMLEACGHGQPGGAAIAGIIGRDGNLWWNDLTTPSRQMTAPTGGTVKASVMEMYDQEFALRVDIADRAAVRTAQDPQVVALCTRWSDCKTTSPWKTVAHEELRAADALTLLTGLPQAQVDKLAAVGITTRTQLAGIADADIAEVQKSSGVVNLGKHVQSARAVVTGQPLARPDFAWFPTVDPSTVWIDIDMENDSDTGIIYLWGARTKDGYTPFADWSGSDEGEGAVFAQFWTWLSAQIANPAAVVYCYTPAEARCLRHLADKHANTPGVPTRDEVEDFLASDQWYDLYDFVKTIAWPTESLSIKHVAKVAGFAWRDKAPSGEASVLWYRQAKAVGSVPAKQRKAVAKRLLTYNEDDVVAMQVIRDFAVDYFVDADVRA